MKHIGIITEYNPFHNGHSYQLHTAKNMFPDKSIIVLMSGNYVQRGEPAIYNKYLRTKCALHSGADIVLELPILFSTASAEYFAHAAIKTFSDLGIIDTLCFGAETDDLALLQRIADVLSDEPTAYKVALQNQLKKGLSFPKARTIALEDILGKEISSVLTLPNNILAIEYLKALKTFHSDITPVLIKRIGNGYHDYSTKEHYSSATAIRNSILNDSNEYKNLMPKQAYDILCSSEFAKPLQMSDFYTMLQYAIWKEKENLEQYLDVSHDLANKLRSIKYFPASYEELVQSLISKHYTHTRIQRICLHILLGITDYDMKKTCNDEYISYIRLLGLRKQASILLKDVKNSEIPIINKVADAKKQLSEIQLCAFEKELHQNLLYTQAFANRYNIHLPSEYEHSVIITD
ncbi:MAG: nucleotidyltransferase [Lachnospiraceae bacterium]|nr:nucleotidyltransferase [Lachnospiraceae bacterium]